MKTVLGKLNKKHFIFDTVLFVHIALPIFCLACVLGFFNFANEVSADIKADYSGIMQAQVFYKKELINQKYDEKHSVKSPVRLRKDKFSHLSVDLDNADKALKGLRLDLGDRPGVKVTVRNLRVEGQQTASLADTSRFYYHDLKLLSGEGADGAVFEVTGRDPFIVSKNEVFGQDAAQSVVNSSKLRFWGALISALMICCALFAMVRFIPSVRNACGVNWGNGICERGGNGGSVGNEVRQVAEKDTETAAGNKAGALSLTVLNKYKGVLSAVLVLLVFTLLCIFRNTKLFVWPLPNAEDFGIFFRDEYYTGFPQTAFMLYAGYIHLLPRLITWISYKFDLSGMVFVMNWTVLLFKILAFYMIYKSKEISSGLLKFAILAYLILMPYPNEMYNNVTNLQWWLLPLMAVIIIKRETSVWLFAFDVYLLILSGLTGLNSILFAIPCAYLLFKVRTINCLIKTSVIIVCALIQFYCLYTSPRIGKIAYDGGILDIINAFVNMVIYHTLGNINSQSLVNIIVLLYYLFIVALNLYYYRRNVIVKFIFVFAAVYLAAIMYNAIKADLRPGVFAPRYWVFLRICTFVLTVSSLDILFRSLLSRDNYKRCMAYSCFLLCLALLSNYPVSFPSGYAYYDDARRFETAASGEVVKFHYPGDEHCKPGSPWVCDLKKK